MTNWDANDSSSYGFFRVLLAMLRSKDNHPKTGSQDFDVKLGKPERFGEE
jgi:hypothetical protein